MPAVERVVIVGGGTSGWMTAAYIASTIGKVQPLDIVLVESRDIGIIGVGEATIPSLPSMLKDIGIAEDDFLAGVNGAFKQAIRFQNWRHDPAEAPSYFYHQFHRGTKADMHAALHFMTLNPGYPTHAFARYYTPQVMACDAGRAPLSLDGRGPGFVYAYHMDAVLFGQFLRQRFEGRLGVRRVEGLVESAERREDGDISAIVLKGGERIAGDLFIDCSGFRGLLINQFLGTEFDSFSRWLPCDRAVAVSAAYKPGESIKPYTLATAQKNGWIWDINLASRRGVGHVYSSSHYGEAEAEKTLEAYLGAVDSGVEMRHIRMRVGRCRELWVGNCVAIGLAGGFIEPLESTGIFLTEMGVRHLVDNWPVGGEGERVRRAAYTRHMHTLFDEILHFVLMHYVVSERRDSEFWRDITSLPSLPPALAEMLELWRYKYPSPYDVVCSEGNVFSYESYIAILAGSGFFRGVVDPLVSADAAGLGRHLKASVESFQQVVSRLPTHDAYLAGVRQRMQGSPLLRPGG